MSSGYILDSSSLFTLFFHDSEETVQEILKESYILDLTCYEIGSVLTKGNDGHIKGLDKNLINSLTKEIEKILAGINVIKLRAPDLSEIIQLALSTGLTFYDSSYIFYCKSHQLSLLTDDSKMFREAMKLGLDAKKAEEVMK